MEGREGGREERTRVDKRNGEDRSVRTTGGGVRGVKNQRNVVLFYNVCSVYSWMEEMQERDRG